MSAKIDRIQLTDREQKIYDAGFIRAAKEPYEVGYAKGRSTLQRELAEAVGGLMDDEQIEACLICINSGLIANDRLKSIERIKAFNSSITKLRALAERK